MLSDIRFINLFYSNLIGPILVMVQELLLIQCYPVVVVTLCTQEAKVPYGCIHTIWARPVLPKADQKCVPAQSCS